MKYLSFFPGTSKTHPDLPIWFEEAAKKGIAELPHRSRQFSELYAECEGLFREKLFLPENYALCFVSSATEVWDLLNRDFENLETLHIVNGAFGEKWHDWHYTVKPEKTKILRYRHDEIPPLPPADAEMICLTHCETSNTSLFPQERISLIRKNFPHAVIAVDATSSMGGINLAWNDADIWFASVQKCFGLPSGLGVLIFRKEITENSRLTAKHYNSLRVLLRNAANYQPHITINVLGVFLLLKRLLVAEKIHLTEQILRERASMILKKFEFSGYDRLLRNETVQSPTVFAFRAENDFLQKIHKKAEESGIIVGKGYGAWADSTFRIANFPQHTQEDFERLFTFLKCL
jgi:phosphoserine aminotransferase